MNQRCLSLPLGIVLRKTPGVTRWAKWSWKAVAVLPGAAQETWRELRREGETVEYHAATVPLELWRTDTEAYMTELATRVPSIYVVMRHTIEPDAEYELEVVLATASPYDAQDYADSGEELVELVPMSDGLIALIQQFITKHHVEEKFVKRKRDKQHIDLVEDGVGDARIDQLTDVYRTRNRKTETVH
ncbi:MAG: DUF3305 domain-containing protein [Amylibacter sp.]|nr:DUF3305 domain-containing protein [Amylibacter sp.]